MFTTQAIVEVPLEMPQHPSEPLTAGHFGSTGTAAEGMVNRRLFTIRAADSHGERSSANILVKRMYATRGYHTTSLKKDQGSNRITLIASEGDVTLGTITVGFDTPDGLLVDQLFREEIGSLRAARRDICEFTTLAMDNAVRSKRVLASLFHVAYIIAHRINRVDDLVIEVNPRHVLYYERMLGFQVMGPERLNTRVQAPALLLRLPLSLAKSKIAEFGGRPEAAATEKSLYPYAFSSREEAGILARIQA